MTRTERLLRLARQRGDRAAELILTPAEDLVLFEPWSADGICRTHLWRQQEGERIRALALVMLSDWTEAELRAAWGDR